MFDASILGITLLISDPSENPIQKPRELECLIKGIIFVGKVSDEMRQRTFTLPFSDVVRVGIINRGTKLKNNNPMGSGCIRILLHISVQTGVWYFSELASSRSSHVKKSSQQSKSHLIKYQIITYKEQG